MEQMRKTTLAVALAALGSVMLWTMSDAFAVGDRQTYAQAYDLDSTSFTACSTTELAPGRGRVTNASSSTTITTVSSVSGFLGLVAGDEVFVDLSLPADASRAWTRRVVATTPTTGSTLVLTVAIDLSANGTAGYAWQFRKVSCGTGAEDGWLLTARSTWTEVSWQVDQLNVTGGIDVRVQCRDSGLAAYTVYPDPANSASANECLKGNFTAVNACRLIVTGHWGECRIQWKIGAADDGGDTGADAESLSAFLSTGPAPLR